MSVQSVAAATQPFPAYRAAAHAAPAPAPQAPPAADPDHDGDVDRAGHVDVRV